MAGGFGIGVPSARVPTEVAPVVPYRDLVTSGYPQSPSTAVASPDDDPEKGFKQRTVTKPAASPSRSAHNDEAGSITSSDTPFFHFDLATAVRTAELGAVKPDSRRTSEDPSVGKGRYIEESE